MEWVLMLLLLSLTPVQAGEYPVPPWQGLCPNHRRSQWDWDSGWACAEGSVGGSGQASHPQQKAGSIGCVHSRPFTLFPPLSLERGGQQARGTLLPSVTQLPVDEGAGWVGVILFVSCSGFNFFLLP
jgi:hypothetical protein